MILRGCSAISGGVASVNYKATEIKPCNGSFSASSHRFPVKFASSRVRCSWGPHQEQRSFTSQAGSPSSYLSPSPSSFSNPEQCGSTQAIHNLPRRCKPAEPPRASSTETDLFNYKAPPMTSKPRWWWRIMACIPFVIPFHETWMFAGPAYCLFPFFQDFKYITFPFLKFLARLPRRWFLVYFIGIYLFIVRRKEWPHFVRYYMCLGLIVEISFHIFASCNQWMPVGIVNGRLGQFAWLAIALNHLVTVVGCVICALKGIYADIPFFGDAAYMHIPYAGPG